MNVTRSGYYIYIKKRWLQKNERTDMQLITYVKELSQKSNYSYGSRRISKSLKAKGFEVGRYRARRLMLKAKVECKQRRIYKITTESNHNLPVAENKLNRKFQVNKPNEVWVTDITYLWTKEGWLYLAAVLDLFSRRVVGWSMSKHLRTELIKDALNMAMKRRQPKTELMHHSDRGSQYASTNYQNTLKKLGIKISMSRKGNCWDNAVMERFFGSLKSERTDFKKYENREQAKADVIDYIEMFYNSERLHSTLDYMSPLQYEKKHSALFC